MSLYIVLAVGAYLFYAINGVADKFLLSGPVKHPISYAFYIGVTAPFVIFLAPFGLKLLSPEYLAIAIVGGACFPIALYFNYVAIQETSISRILPIMGGLVPIYTLILAYFALHERLNQHQLLAFVFLVIGAVIISFRKEHHHWHAKALGSALVAAFFFAISLTVEKYIFQVSDSFVTGIVWTRVGVFLASMSFLISKRSRRYIFEAPKQVSNPNKLLYYGTRINGFLGTALQHFAIRLGSVTIVNALQGTQFALLLAITSVLSFKYPNILKERVNPQTITQKIISITLISIGLVLLAI